MAAAQQAAAAPGAAALGVDAQIDAVRRVFRRGRAEVPESAKGHALSHSDGKNGVSCALA